MTLRVEDIDLTDLANFSEGAPHELFAALRARDPVHWQPEPDGPGLWMLTRHADIVAVSQDSATFASGVGGSMIFDLEFSEERPRLMTEMDPPQHTRHRALIHRGFTPRQVSQLEASVRGFAEEILERALADGRCDFVPTVAAELPLTVILELMGIPQSDRPYLFGLANRVIGFDDPEYADPNGGENTEAITEMASFSRELARTKQRSPGDDLSSALLQVEVDGERLSEQEFDMFFLLLVTAGSETTRNAISGGTLAFADHLDQWERLRAERTLLPLAVEEVLRWTTPAQYFRRTATCDTQIAGQAIMRGQKVVMWYASANRDEAVFDDPFRFDVARSPNPHLTFGIGRHFCLGANLARLELRTMFDAMLDRELRVEPLGRPEWLRSNFAQSIKRMPVEIRTAD